MASGIYTCFKDDLFKKQVDLSADTIKVALLNNSHSFSAANTTWADVSTNEISGTGYTAGGLTLTSLTVSTSGTTVKFDAADAVWSTATFSAYHAVLYDTTNSNSLICSFDFGGVQSPSGVDFEINWDADGIIDI